MPDRSDLGDAKQQNSIEQRSVRSLFFLSFLNHHGSAIFLSCFLEDSFEKVELHDAGPVVRSALTFREAISQCIRANICEKCFV